MHEIYCEVNVCYKCGFKCDFMRFIEKSSTVNASPILSNGDSSLLFLVSDWLFHSFITLHLAQGNYTKEIAL